MGEVATTKQDSNFAIIEQVLVTGDLSRLNAEQRVSYYNKTCASVGLNPLTKPFDYITLNGKLVLYAKRDCADQLRRIYDVSIAIKERREDEEFATVYVSGELPSGRKDEACGVVVIKGLKGLDLANARMKAETKAKRRLTLSICGLGMLDETEVEDIPDKYKYNVRPQQPEEGDGFPDFSGVYRIPFGKFSGKGLEEIYADPKIGPAEIKAYIALVESPKWRERYGQQHGENADRFIMEAEKFLGEAENAPLMQREPGDDS